MSYARQRSAPKAVNVDKIGSIHLVSSSFLSLPVYCQFPFLDLQPSAWTKIQMASQAKSKRSFTGQHTLLPAIKPAVAYDLIPRVPTYNLIAWTFGRGSVVSENPTRMKCPMSALTIGQIWKIWPAVLLHTIFAACKPSDLRAAPLLRFPVRHRHTLAQD